MWDRPLPRAVLALAIAVGVAVWKGPTILAAARAGSLQTTTGVVTEAAEPASSLRGNRQMHRVHLEYEYEVGARTYTSDRVTLFNNQFATRDQAARFADDHPQGREVTVHYDPASPGVGALVPPRTAVTPTLIFWGALVLAALGAGAYYAYAALRSRAGAG